MSKFTLLLSGSVAGSIFYLVSVAAAEETSEVFAEPVAATSPR